MSIGIPPAPPPGSIQRLSLIEQSTSTWISGATRRHPLTLIIAAAVIAVGQLAGAAVDLRAYAAMALWIAIAAVEGPWCTRPAEFETRRNRYAVTLVIDAIMLGAAYYFVNGAQFLGVGAFLLVVVSAVAVLPKRLALAVTVLVVAVYTTVVVLAVRGPQTIASPFGMPSVAGNEPFLAASVTAAAVVVYLMMRMQAHVVRTVRDAETRHQAVVQSAADMILVFDERGWVAEVNQATLARSGYTWDELKALPNSALFPPEDWDTVLEAFKRTLAGQTQSIECRVIAKGGEVLWTETTTAPVMIGDRPAVVVVARDVTERRRQQEQLRDHDAKLGLVLDALNSGFYTIDLNQVVTSVRGKGSDSGSEQTSRLVGRSVVTIAPSPEQAVVQREQHEKALAGDVVTWVWPVGSGRWVRSHVAPVKDPSGAVIGAAGFWRDETAIVRAREEKDSRWNRFRDTPPSTGRTSEDPTG